MTKTKSWEGKLRVLAAAVLLLAGAVVIFTGCSGPAYSQTIRIDVESLNVGGMLTKVEYYRDGELVNSVNLIDGDGDTIIDGKSGPSEGGLWPRGWEWFDDLYRDVTVGYSTMTLAEGKVIVQNGTTYEFMTGEYECERVG